jgi:bacteriocin-like protein
MTMNTDKLESTGNVSLGKKGLAHDHNELSDQELQVVTGGSKNGFFAANLGQLEKIFTWL